MTLPWSKYDEARRLVLTAQLGSCSMLERRLRVTHEEALELMKELAIEGVVGVNNTKGDMRPVLLSAEIGLLSVIDLQDQEARKL